MQNTGRPHITDFDPLMRAFTQGQSLFEVFGDKVLVAGFELPAQMYDTLDSAVVMTGEVQFAVAQQNELMNQLGNQMGTLPDGITAGIQGLFTMLEGALGYIGEVQFQSVCTLLDLLQVSELTAKASAQMLTFMAQDTGGGGFLNTLLGGLGVAAGAGGLAATAGGATGTTTVTTAGTMAAGGTAATSAGTLAAGGFLGGPLAITLALAALATTTAVGVGVSNANKQKKRMEAAEAATNPINKLGYADPAFRSGAYTALIDNRNNWRESMEQSQALTQLQPFTSDTTATDTMIDLLRKLVDKPVDRTVKSEVVIQSLHANQTMSEFRDMLTALLKYDEQISI